MEFALSREESWKLVKSKKDWLATFNQNLFVINDCIWLIDYWLIDLLFFFFL